MVETIEIPANGEKIIEIDGIKHKVRNNVDKTVVITLSEAKS